MIVVEKLLEPKKTSGMPLAPGKSIKIGNISVVNRDAKITFYVRTFTRKDRPRTKAKKGPKPNGSAKPKKSKRSTAKAASLL